jgi:hypothetical protein
MIRSNYIIFVQTKCCRVPFSCFALLDSLSMVPRASAPVFIFFAHRLVFGGTERVGSCFQVLRSRIHFRLYRGRRVTFSSFERPDSFSAVPTASGLVFGGYEGAGYHFYVLLSRSRFPRNRGRRVPFSSFAHPDSFSAVPRASGPDFMFCAPELVFDVTEGVGSHFQVLRAPIRFRRYRGRRLTFSCFGLTNLFSAVPMASAPIFMFCAPGLVFGDTDGVGTHFHVFRSRTHF